MTTNTTNYQDSFITIAEDSPATAGEVPPAKDGKKTAASIQFEMVHNTPYKYTSDDVLFQVFADKNDLTKSEYKGARENFFSKGQPCFRASPLTKRYGWGVHSDEKGRIALYGCETKEYKKMSLDKSLKVLKAMKSGR